MRILGIDYGEKRIGLAISDRSKLVATPLKTIQNSENLNQSIKEIVDKNDVEKIVIGMPKTLRDTKELSAKTVSEFIKTLQNSIPSIPIIEWDERFTTAQAEKLLINAGVKRKRRKKKIDKIAAQIILQSFLDREKKGNVK